MRAALTRVLCLTAAAAAAAAAAAPAAAQPAADFDDLPGDLAPVPDGYRGVAWEAGAGTPDPTFGLGWWHWNPSATTSGQSFLPSSGAKLAFSYADAAPLRFAGGPAVFRGAAFTGGGTALFQLFLGGALVHTSAALVVTRAPQFLASGYDGPVDRVVVVQSARLVAVDDVTFTVAAVPEPATSALVGVGLTAAALRRRARGARRGG